MKRATAIFCLFVATGSALASDPDRSASMVQRPGPLAVRETMKQLKIGMDRKSVLSLFPASFFGHVTSIGDDCLVDVDKDHMLILRFDRDDKRSFQLTRATLRQGKKVIVQVGE
jgi:hypothetical protein